MAMTFGETSFHYNAIDPVTGNWQRKIGFVKRVTAYGAPILVGSGIYLD